MAFIKTSRLFSGAELESLIPAYEGDPDTPKVVPKDQWYLPPAKPTDAPSNDGSKP